MNRYWIFLSLFLIALGGCKSDETYSDRVKSKSTENELIGKWQSEATESDGVKTKTEIRFSKGKITKLSLVEQNGTFVPLEDDQGIRQSKTYFFTIVKSDGSHHDLSISEDPEFTAGTTETIKLELSDENTLNWTGSDEETITVKRTD